MSNGKIFYNNLIENATITASPTEAVMEGFGIEYLGNNNQGVVFRSSEISGTEIRFSFDSAVSVKGIVVMNHNLVTGDPTCYFEASADGFETTPADESEVITWDKSFVELENPWVYKDYRLRLSKSSGTYIQVGEVYLFGDSYPFDRNYTWNYTYTKEINRNSKETTSGQIYRNTRFIRKGFAMDFDGMTDTQKATFEDISESDYVCFLPTGAGGDLHFGIIDFSSYNHVYSNYWTANINFTENPK